MRENVARSTGRLEIFRDIGRFRARRRGSAAGLRTVAATSPDPSPVGQIHRPPHLVPRQIAEFARNVPGFRARQIKSAAFSPDARRLLRIRRTDARSSEIRRALRPIREIYNEIRKHGGPLSRIRYECPGSVTHGPDRSKILWSRRTCQRFERWIFRMRADGAGSVALCGAAQPPPEISGAGSGSRATARDLRREFGKIARARFRARGRCLGICSAFSGSIAGCFSEELAGRGALKNAMRTRTRVQHLPRSICGRWGRRVSGRRFRGRCTFRRAHLRQHCENHLGPILTRVLPQ